MMLDIVCRYNKLSYSIAYESIMMHVLLTAVLQTENMPSLWSPHGVKTATGQKEKERVRSVG